VCAAAGITGSELPPRHALTVSVPGAAALWEDALQRWGSGSSSLADVLAPAIELAEGGFPVGPIASFEWQQGAATIRQAGGHGVRALITEEGSGPKPGQIWRNPDLAATFRRLAEHGASKGECVRAACGVGWSLLLGRYVQLHRILQMVGHTRSLWHWAWRWSLHVALELTCGVGAYMWRWSLHVALEPTCGVGAYMWRWSLHVALELTCGVGAYMWRWSLHVACSTCCHVHLLHASSHCCSCCFLLLAVLLPASLGCPA
jgi:hypothetical protein